MAEVELHLERLDVAPAALARAWTKISADERARAERFRFGRDRDRFVAGRALVREIVGRAVGRAAHEIEFAYGPAGKPSVDGISFNAANSEDLVLVAVARDGEIGVDLERVRELPDRDLLAADYFHDDEHALWSAIAPPQRTSAFFRWWTAKEAFLKATGAGLGGPLRETAIDFHPAHPLRFLAPSPWELEEISAPAGYQAVLCRGGNSSF